MIVFTGPRLELAILLINLLKDLFKPHGITFGDKETVCTQLIEQLRKGFTVLKVTRTGADRSTTFFCEILIKNLDFQRCISIG